MESMLGFSRQHPDSNMDLLIGLADLWSSEIGNFDHHIPSALGKMRIMREWKEMKANGIPGSYLALYDELVDQAPRYKVVLREFARRWVYRSLPDERIPSSGAEFPNYPNVSNLIEKAA